MPVCSNYSHVATNILWFLMAMSRFLSRTSLRSPTPLMIAHHRHRSTKTNNAQFSEVDEDAVSVEVTIHSVIVRRAAPYWLPFLPGYSYWVPPHAGYYPAGSMIYAIGKSTSPGQSGNRQGLSEDEQMSITSKKGWPSYAFFIQGTSAVHPAPSVGVEVKIQDSKDNADWTSNSKNENENENENEE